jgi:hypothetical protein
VEGALYWLWVHSTGCHTMHKGKKAFGKFLFTWQDPFSFIQNFQVLELVFCGSH